MKIVRYNKVDDIDVEFQDEFKHVKTTTYSNFKIGCVKNPYDRSKYGVGYIGVGKHRAKVNGQYNYIYDVWADMINRCYHSKDRFSAYYGICTVCPEWHDFQAFGDWYEEHEYKVDERLHLDKDILYPDNKEYGSKKCILVPQRINMLFMNIPNKRGLPNGVLKEKKGYLAKYNGEYIGVYPTVEDAYYAYTSVKEKAIREVTDEYKDILPKEVYDAIYNYKFNIRNDKNYKVA